MKTRSRQTSGWASARSTFALSSRASRTTPPSLSLLLYLFSFSFLFLGFIFMEFYQFRRKNGWSRTQEVERTGARLARPSRARSSPCAPSPLSRLLVASNVFLFFFCSNLQVNFGVVSSYRLGICQFKAVEKIGRVGHWLWWFSSELSPLSNRLLRSR